MKQIVFLSIMLLSAYAALGDIPGPGPKAETVTTADATLTIRLDTTANEAKLIIPRSQIKSLKAQLEEMDSTDGGTLATAPRTGSIVAGVFLSLGFVFGGLWLLRSRPVGPGGRALAVIGASAAALFATAIVYANVAPPSMVRGISSKIFSEAVHRSGAATGPIKVQVRKDDRSVIELIVPDTSNTGREE